MKIKKKGKKGNENYKLKSLKRFISSGNMNSPTLVLVSTEKRYSLPINLFSVGGEYGEGTGRRGT